MATRVVTVNDVLDGHVGLDLNTQSRISCHICLCPEKYQTGYRGGGPPDLYTLCLADRKCWNFTDYPVEGADYSSEGVMTKLALEKIASDIVDLLERADEAAKRRAAVAAVDLAVQKTDLRAPQVTNARAALAAGRVGDIPDVQALAGATYRRSRHLDRVVPSPARIKSPRPASVCPDP